MGLIDGLLTILFGSGRNVIRETAEVFRENSEAGATRDADYRRVVMQEFGKEFQGSGPGLFDRMMDGLNRIPRPALALGTIGLFVSAMVDPIWFASRMQGIALVPEPLWWLLGAIISFYFGARHQAKGQHFQRSISDTVARAGQVTENIRSLQALERGASDDSRATPDPIAPPEASNPALADWRAQNG